MDRGACETGCEVIHIFPREGTLKFRSGPPMILYVGRSTVATIPTRFLKDPSQ
jgi:hypothetical protein